MTSVTLVVGQMWHLSVSGTEGKNGCTLTRPAIISPFRFIASPIFFEKGSFRLIICDENLTFHQRTFHSRVAFVAISSFTSRSN